MHFIAVLCSFWVKLDMSFWLSHGTLHTCSALRVVFLLHPARTVTTCSIGRIASNEQRTHSVVILLFWISSKGYVSDLGHGVGTYLL